MDDVVCVNVSVFTRALTNGKTYQVLEHDPQRRLIKLVGDNGRIRWFPFYCFRMGLVSVAKILRVNIEDPIMDPACDCVEVVFDVVQAGGESRRWCYALTPAYLMQKFPGGVTEPMITGRHGIIMYRLTHESIVTALRYLEKNNLLEECTLPMGL
jgi:hypothetical protein